MRLTTIVAGALAALSLTAAPALALAQSAAAEAGKTKSERQRAERAKGGTAVSAKPLSAKEIDAQRKKAGDVSAQVKAAGLACTVTDARLVGETKEAKYYELACQEGLGRGLVVKADGVQTTDCIATNERAADGSENGLKCQLPANQNVLAQAQTLLTKASSSCQATQARYIGGTADRDLYEMACQDGQGFVLTVEKQGGAAKAQSCLLYDDATGSVKCTLTTAESRASFIQALAAKSPNACPVKGQRYVMTTTANRDYFEIACQDGKGFMLEANGAEVVRAIPCAEADFVSGGCTLTDSRAAKTEEAGIYTAQAKKAGFDCTVDKYGTLPARERATEVVELHCSNRPDGAVGIFKASGGVIYDCARAESLGYRCSFSKPQDALPAYKTVVAQTKFASCVPSEVRATGSSNTARTDQYVEIGCADGSPGLLLHYAGDAKTPEAVTCAAMRGACKLPNNLKK